jgi:hypothetical protein
VRLDVLARDRPAGPKQSAEQGTTGKFRHDRLDSRLARRPAHRSARTGGARQSSASLEVSHSPSALTGRAALSGAPTSGRSRFGVRVPSARALERTSRTGASPLRFFAKRIGCVDARSGGRFFAGPAFQSNPSPARVGIAARRRVDDLLPSRCAFDRSCRRDRGNRSTRSRAIRPLRAPALQFRRPIRVMRRRLSSRGVPLPAIEHARPGRATRVLPSCRRPTALMGFNPFAGLLPHSGG